MKFTFIGYTVQSGNKYMWAHWSVYAKDKKQNLARFQSLYRSGVARHDDSHANRHMRVKFTAYRKRLLDDDNFITGLKSFRDCLTVMGFIKDDNRQWATFEYEQKLIKESPFANAKGEPVCALVIEVNPIQSVGETSQDP